MIKRWPVQANDGHGFELLAAVPAEPRAVVLFVCALGVEASYYEEFAEAMASQGVALVLCDLRGNGTSSVRPSRGADFGYREIVERDIPAAVEVVRSRAPSMPFFLGGHSLGGQLALLHIAATRPELAGVPLVACAIPYYKSWQGNQRRWILFATKLFPVVGLLLGYVPGRRLGFGGPAEARTMMRDWSHNARTARYEPIGSNVDYEGALRDLRVDFVTVNIVGDEMGPPKAVDFMFQKLPNARGERIEAELSEPRGGAHFRWARDSAEVVAALTAWIGKK